MWAHTDGLGLFHRGEGGEGRARHLPALLVLSARLRALARLLDRELKRPLSSEILFGKLENGGTARIGTKLKEIDPDADTPTGDDEEQEPERELTFSYEAAKPEQKLLGDGGVADRKALPKTSSPGSAPAGDATDDGDDDAPDIEITSEDEQPEPALEKG